MMKRPPQILVRGCAYGDLEGKTMYTIASGKRGPAYLTKWKTLVPLNNSSSPPGGPPPVGSGGSHVIGKFGIQVANECCIDWNSGSYVFNDFNR